MLIKDHRSFALYTIKNLAKYFFPASSFLLVAQHFLLINYSVLILGRLHELPPAVNMDKE